MKVLSCFDGMSCGQIALNRAGHKIDKYYSSEIDKFAIKVTQANYPDTVQLGDIERWREWDIDWAAISLFIGGSPCQGFSFAGKQLNFSDPRSKLFFTWVDILNHIKKFNPEVKFLLENVNMKREYLRIISEYLGVFPVRINSRLVSAQNRDRWYWSNIRTKDVGLFAEQWTDIPQPEDKGILLKDILQPENEIDQKYYLSDKLITSMLMWNSSSNPVHNAIDGNNKSRCATARGIGEIHSDMQLILTHSLQPRNGKGQGGKGHLMKDDNRSYCVDTTNNQAIEYSGKLRRLTPIECERLQTVPDNYTASVSDSQRYKMLGNGWTVDVIAHILNLY